MIAAPVISAPSCYGKLPALGDYLRHRAPGTEVGLWWNRFAALPAAVSSASTTKAQPWCFVLAPDVFSWAAGVHVVGVLMLSRDRVGRPYPLVVWQKASPKGLRHAALFGTESPRNWLFWLSQLMFGHVRPARAASSEPTTDFTASLDALWELFRPSWTARLGMQAKMPADALCRELVGSAASSADKDSDIDGVRFMPWAEWPQTLWQPRALCWFWQQDSAGRYLRVLRDHHFGKRVLASMMATMEQ